MARLDGYPWGNSKVVPLPARQRHDEAARLGAERWTASGTSITLPSREISLGRRDQVLRIFDARLRIDPSATHFERAVETDRAARSDVVRGSAWHLDCDRSSTRVDNQRWPATLRLGVSGCRSFLASPVFHRYALHESNRGHGMKSMRAGQAAVPIVEFCNDAAPLAKIGSAMCAELELGNAVVSIATGTHRRLLETQVTAYGIDIIAALSTGQYVSLNALEALSRIIVDGVPDVVRFDEVVRALVDRIVARYRRVLIFGELVPLMHSEGECAGAVELETLWRSFVASRPTFLNCEYPAHTIHNYSSISFAHRGFSRDIPGTPAVVREQTKVAESIKGESTVTWALPS